MDIRGLYIVEGNSYPDFVELENRGLTTVFYKDSFILNDYTVCKKNLCELTDALASTNLKLVINMDLKLQISHHWLILQTNHIETR